MNRLGFVFNFPIFCLVPMCLAPFRGMVLAMSKMVGNRICVSFFVPFVFLLLCMLYSSYVMCGCGYFSVFIKIYLFYSFIYLFIVIFQKNGSNSHCRSQHCFDATTSSRPSRYWIVSVQLIQLIGLPEFLFSSVVFKKIVA